MLGGLFWVGGLVRGVFESWHPMKDTYGDGSYFINWGLKLNYNYNLSASYDESYTFKFFSEIVKNEKGGGDHVTVSEFEDFF